MEKSLSGGLRDLSEPQKKALEDMTAAIINKMLHDPISHLKRSSDDDQEATLYIAALKRLFGLEKK